MDLYLMPESPPCRAVLMVAAHLDIHLNLINIDLSKGEQLREEFVKKNPFHVVPTLVDGDFILWESRAIIAYLADKSENGDKLYPKDLQLRATVNKLLYQELGLYNLISSYMQPLFVGKKPNQLALQRFKDGMKLMDQYLSDRRYMAGDRITLADISLLASLSLAETCSLDYDQFKNVTELIKRLKSELPYYESTNKIAMENITAFIKAKMAEAKD